MCIDFSEFTYKGILNAYPNPYIWTEPSTIIWAKSTFKKLILIK